MRTTTLLLSAILLFGLPADAQPRSAADSQAHFDAVRAAIESSNVLANVQNQTLINIRDYLIAHLLARNPGKESEVRALVDEILMPDMRRTRIWDFDSFVIRLWSQVISDQEINEIREFFGSQAGKKMAALLGLVPSLGFEFGRDYIAQFPLIHEQEFKNRGLRY